MKQNETKFNDVGSDGLYLPQELNRRRLLLLLLNIIILGLLILLLFLAGVFIGDEEYQRFASYMIVPVVILVILRSSGLLFYHYDPKGKQSEMTAKGQRFMLIFSVFVFLAIILIDRLRNISIMETGTMIFIVLVIYCQQVCEDQLYYRHLIEFYRKIENKHDSTEP